MRSHKLKSQADLADIPACGMAHTVLGEKGFETMRQTFNQMGRWFAAPHQRGLEPSGRLADRGARDRPRWGMRSKVRQQIKPTLDSLDQSADGGRSVHRIKPERSSSCCIFPWDSRPFSLHCCAVDPSFCSRSLRLAEVVVSAP